MDRKGESTKKVAEKTWACPICKHVNDANHFFFCQKCGNRNIATYG